MINFFKRRKKPIDTTIAVRNASVEIKADKDAKAEAFAEAKKATQHLNYLLEVENGFTMKIYLAAGGSHTEKKG